MKQSGKFNRKEAIRADPRLRDREKGTKYKRKTEKKERKANSEIQQKYFSVLALVLRRKKGNHSLWVSITTVWFLTWVNGLNSHYIQSIKANYFIVGPNLQHPQRQIPFRGSLSKQQRSNKYIFKYEVPMKNYKTHKHTKHHGESCH